MAKYRVNCKALTQQGDEIKAIAKQVGTYSERLEKICANLGEDQMLAEVRTKLNKLSSYFGEARASLGTAGELLSRSVQSYTSTEKRNVKRVDGVKAHSRDFYKNPVVVASAGGTAATPAPTTINYTETNTVNYIVPANTSATATGAAVESAGVPAAATAAAAATGMGTGAAVGSGMGTGAAAGIGVVAGAAVGSVGTGILMNTKGKSDSPEGAKPQDDSPDAELEHALAEARRAAADA